MPYRRASVRKISNSVTYEAGGDFHQLTSNSEVIVVGAGASGIVAATRFAEAGMKTLLVESGGPFFARDGGQAIQPWQRLIDPNTNITRHDGLSFFSFGLPTGPGASAFYDSSVPALAPKGLGGGTGVNGAQQFWPPRRYLDKYFGFQGLH
ncbi:hypothetical protein KVT40_007662 [Elsinoe batatas]|uniref:GMC family oxidoreductase n=1 Tax=Elsinoe batatas TaxID=2601811 RepID=A0A8K0KZ78_9PEZI|nr:hypothetical protein KVT40_007662 [Elsinoe batatas]